MIKRLVVKLNDFSHVPDGSVYRGKGIVDFETIDNGHLEKVSELFVELDDKGKETFRKPGFVGAIPQRPSRGRP